MTAKTAARGVIIEMGDRKVNFRPLNFATLELLQDDLDYVGAMDTGARKGFFKKEEIEKIINVVHTALANVDGDITREWVKKNLDLANFQEVLTAVFTTNGFIVEQVELPLEGAASGEAPAAASAT